MVDLIPQEYRQAVHMRRLLRGVGWTCLALALAVGAAAAGLAYLVNDERMALARYRQLQAQSRAQGARLAELTARRNEAQKQLQTLDALRGGASIGQLVAAVDTALGERIWFQELSFSRVGDVIDRKAESAGAGYVVLAAKDKRPEEKGGETGWRARERAEIRGLAADHAVLAEFIKQLGAQPEVRQVKLIDTSARSYPNVQVVDFQLAALLGPAPGATQ